MVGSQNNYFKVVLSKDPVLRYQVGTKIKTENITVPGFFLSTGGTESPVLDPYSPMISSMQKTRMESRNPVIKTELTV